MELSCGGTSVGLWNSASHLYQLFCHFREGVLFKVNDIFHITYPFLLKFEPPCVVYLNRFIVLKYASICAFARNILRFLVRSICIVIGMINWFDSSSYVIIEQIGPHMVFKLRTNKKCEVINLLLNYFVLDLFVLNLFIGWYNLLSIHSCGHSVIMVMYVLCKIYVITWSQLYFYQVWYMW